MFYNPKEELILKKGQTLDTVSAKTKFSIFDYLEVCLEENTNHKGKYLRFRNMEMHCIEEIFSRGTMMCNAIMSRGYNNILFVGHYNDHQSHWMLDQFSGRMVDVMPSERVELFRQTFPDLNVMCQFIPVVMQSYGYDASFSVVRPPEEKYTGVMLPVHEKFGLDQRSLSCSVQYKHGITGWNLDAQKEDKFDAVVFLGVPMQYPEVGFEEDQVRERFAPFCTPDFEMIDIYYGANYENKWQNGEAKDFTPHIETAFTVRASWDEDFGGKEDRPEEFDIMDRMFSVY